MENNLDKFFKDKLHSREFERKPAHWEAATRLIELEEKKKRRRRFFIWWFMGVLVLVSISMFWYWSIADITSQTSAATSNATEQKDPAINSTEQATAPIEQLNNTNKNSNNPDNDNSTASNSNTTAIAKSSTALDAATEQNNTTQNNTTTSLEKAENNSAQTIDSNKGKSNTTTQASSTRKTTLLKDQDGEGLNEQAIDSGLNEQNINKAGIVAQENKQTKNQADSKVETTTKAEVPSLKRSFVVLPVAGQWSDLAANTLSLEEFELNNPATNPKRVLRVVKWAFGLSLGTNIYPYQDRSQLVIGYTGGLSAKYRFNTQWSINGDLLYEQRTGSFDAIKMTAETEFKFGKRSTNYLLIPEKMHSLSLPIYLQFKNGRSIIESGIGLDYLLAVNGLRQEEQSLYPWERPDNNQLTALTEEKVWMTKDNFNTWNAKLILGYRYSFHKNWNIWGRANYLLGSIFKKETLETEFNYIESNPITITIGTTFYIF